MSSNSSSLSQSADEKRSSAGLKEGPARVVITAEEAMTVPQSALRPPKELEVTPGKEPSLSVDAVISMALGIIGAPLIGILVGFFAIWFGFLALKQINGPKRLRGRGLALCGIALGAFDIVLWLVLVFVYAHSLFSKSGD